MDSEEALLEGVDRDNLADSEILERIHSDDPDIVMPPPDSNRTLSAAEKTAVEQWILQGAKYEKHWSFQALVRPGIPLIAQIAAGASWDEDTIGGWSNNPIDAFVGKQLIENDLRPAPAADGHTLLRRSSLTLTGLLPPTALRQPREKAVETIELDAAVDAAVDVLLKSDAYAERQTLLWLDASRYADTDGYQNDYERQNWPWRDWVVAAYRDNMPFDQFAIEQLAGDMLPEASDSQRLATAFNRNHCQNAEGGALAEEFRVENVVDRVETTATVFLGLTMGCARCHDHKYDPLSQKEFFQMFAYFNNIGDKAIGKGVEANPTMRAVSPLESVDKERLARYWNADQAFDDDQTAFDQRLKVWTKKMQTIARAAAADDDNEGDVETELVESSPVEPKTTKPSTTKAKSVAAADIGILESDLEKYQEIDIPVQQALKMRKRKNPQRRLLREYFTKLDPKRLKLQTELDAAKKDFSDHGDHQATVMIMQERGGKPTPAYLLLRGQYDHPDKSEKLSRGVPAVLLEDTGKQPTTRLELARWLVSKDNPLTARVIVNRIWRDHFGIGLVKTTGDFGVQGEVPSHPDLLDWLAVEFVESGWDVKALHRLILTSQTYRQSSKITEEQYALDPHNRLLARGPRYRADGFTIRDMALQASGLLNMKMGGPAVKPYQPDGLWEVVAADKGTRYRPSTGDSLYRKSMYSFWKRAVNPPRQSIFDAGGRERCSVQIRRTNTPLQALVLMNDKTFIEAARVLAELTLKQDFDSDGERIASVYRRAVGRPIDEPTMVVLQDGLDYFRRHFTAQTAEAKQLVTVGETRPDESLDVTEHAALTAVAHVVLNLDEFVTIE